ncbi:hypothetical protein PROFUN_03083 [Planoprotostelium fungivorum]|uniref:Uncharacterized protein n=1 Tax=Planoprotostelium fungivorum TaxID=1890364 RepID=A0A2P6NQ57_9EUKA|nr:hypothetical protein PROFUN_03083 [Planoprotostelium fungivorum]
MRASLCFPLSGRLNFGFYPDLGHPQWVTHLDIGLELAQRLAVYLKICVEAVDTSAVRGVWKLNSSSLGVEGPSTCVSFSHHFQSPDDVFRQQHTT